MRKPVPRLRGKFTMLLISVLLAAVALARVPALESSRFGSYLGGSAGGLVFGALGLHLQGWMGSTAFIFIAGTACAGSVAFYLAALGVSAGEWLQAFRHARGSAAFISEKIAVASEYFAAWHAKYASPEKAAAIARPRRVSLNEDTKPDEAPAESEEKSELSIIPRKKPVVTPRPAPAKPQKEDRQKKLNLGTAEEWHAPPLDLFGDPPASAVVKLDEAALQKNAEMLHATLNDFGVQGDILKVSPGPIVTLYEMEPAPVRKRRAS